MLGQARIYMAKVEEGHVSSFHRGHSDFDEFKHFYLPFERQSFVRTFWNQYTGSAGRSDDIPRLLLVWL